jgi:hypothetical protein
MAQRHFASATHDEGDWHNGILLLQHTTNVIGTMAVACAINDE